MRVNSDFSQHALMLPSQYSWQTSPQAGVERVMLDRIGAEKARATGQLMGGIGEAVGVGTTFLPGGANHRPNKS